MKSGILTFALCLLWAFPAMAFKPSADDRRDIARAEEYLNARRNISANFIQTANSGETVTGTILIKRPGKMNISYDPPMKDFIIADGSFLYMWDGELEISTTIPMGDSLADLILRANLKLSGDVAVAGIERSRSKLEITLRQVSSPDNGTMTLLFEDNPFILHGWRVQDAQNRVTTVAFQNMKENVELPDRSFSFVPPKLGKSTRTDKPINR
ncbi:MAG: outer membrane lipoprotein carrier protein LolA [Alphaproteobacteria bacterium]